LKLKDKREKSSNGLNLKKNVKMKKRESLKSKNSKTMKIDELRSRNAKKKLRKESLLFSRIGLLKKLNQQIKKTTKLLSKFAGVKV
jgi:hypothetical protein